MRELTMTRLSALLLSTLLVVSIVGAVAFGPVAAEHPDDATDYTDEANFTISEVSQSDHYPGEDEASMQYFSSGEDAFEAEGAEEGIFLDFVIIDADWIDYSDCDTENTAAFGIDRGNDNEGTQYDEDLVQKRKDSAFRDDGITIEFYNHDDLGGDPPYLAPEDAIVAEQGENSAGGGCLSITDEPGWYRMDGFLNGTQADNGEDQEPSEDAAQVEVATQSTWFYVCDCESEEEAREELGDPPGETAGDGESTDEGGEEAPEGEESAEETPEEGAEEEPAEDGEAESEETPEEGAEEEPAEEEEEPAEEEPEGEEESAETPEEGAEEEPAEEEPAEEEPAEEEPAEEEPGEEEPAEETPEEGAEEEPAEETPAEQEPEDDGEMTPEADGDGPGFGPLAALVALLASALLVVRRR